MPAPIRPNTAAATAAVRRRGDLTAAERLIAAGWTVTPPSGGDTGLTDEVHFLSASRRHLVLDLTRFEAAQLLTMATSADAGDLYELLDRHGHRIAAAQRALDKLRTAVNTTEQE